MAAANSCSCGCSTMTTLTAAQEECSCGCACCADGTKKSKTDEIEELTNLRRAIDKRLAELEPEGASS